MTLAAMIGTVRSTGIVAMPWAVAWVAGRIRSRFPSTQRKPF